MPHIHRTGPVRQASKAVAVTDGLATNAIEVGTLVAASSSAVVPIESFPWSTDIATTRTNFVAAFLGASVSRSRAGKGDPEDLTCLYAQDGDFECEVASATYQIGDYLTPVKAAGDALTNVLTKTSATKANAVAVVTQDLLVAGTKVMATLVNTTIKR